MGSCAVAGTTEYTSDKSSYMSDGCLKSLDWILHWNIGLEYGTGMWDWNLILKCFISKLSSKLSTPSTHANTLLLGSLDNAYVVKSLGGLLDQQYNMTSSCDYIVT